MNIVIGVNQLAQLIRNFDAQSLNPQPLPPKEGGYQRYGNWGSRALNPQPLPPKALADLFARLYTFNSRLLNPQPLPPKNEPAFAGQVTRLGDEVALNPQPFAAQRVSRSCEPSRSWFCHELYRLLRRHQSALAVVDKGEGDSTEAPREVTAPFVYVRLRKGEYADTELEAWAKWIRSQNVDVLCYLKHDDDAPRLAKRLLAALGSL
jgi:hypothetical protein